MGHIVQSAASGSAAGYENGYFLFGSLLLAVGILGTLFVNPERSISRLLGGHSHCGLHTGAVTDSWPAMAKASATSSSP
jgi:hypothetical protein